MIYPFEQLHQHIKSHIAVFLGSGSSVNNITEKQWEILKTFDLWGINNWVYHPDIVPHFYHIELKSYDWEIVRDRLEEKWGDYKHCHYVIPVNRDLITRAISHPESSKIYTYRFKPRGEHPKYHNNNTIDANYNPSYPALIKSYDASVTLMMDMLYKFGYQYIILVGVDISDSKYFWTGGSEKVYGKVHHQWNKQHEGKSPNAPHNTSHVTDFIVDFNKRHMLPYKREIFIQSKKSALYPRLRHIDI